MTKSATLDQEMCILRKLIDNLDASASKVLSDREIDAHRRTGAFQYIPLYTSAFLSQMVQALTMFTKANPGKWPTFIDVGCGIGTKVLLAQACGTNAWGIELNRKYVEVARSRHIAPKQIIHGNALKHDYSAYDIIYFYRGSSKPPSLGRSSWPTPLDNPITMMSPSSLLLAPAVPCG